MAASKKTRRQNTSDGLPDDPVTAYARAVAERTIIAGPLVRAAGERHLKDLQQGDRRGLTWDLDAARHTMGFFPDVLRLAEGEHQGKPFTLEPPQQFIIGSLFGWKKGPHRRFRTCYAEMGKGNGKSPLSAGVGIYMLCADGEASAECYAAATTRDQAKIPFRDAANMVDASPALSARIQKSGKREVINLAHLASGSYFRPISAEGRSLDGKRVQYALIDELHEALAVVVEKMVAGVKGRRQPLILEITNSGVDRTSICYQHHEYSERVVTGLIEDDEWFAYVCGLDPGDDWQDEVIWPKANPLLDVSVTREYLRKQVREAIGMPAKQSIVRRLNFCEWMDAANPAIDGPLWLACEAEFDPRDLAGEPVAALDLSGTRDLTALALLWPPDDEGIVHAVVEFWTPAETLVARAREDRVPYDLWVSLGHVTATPGRAVDYAFVAQRLSELQSEFGLRRVAFDPYRIKYLEQDIAAAGVELELAPHGQGYRRSTESELWMPRSVELLETLIGEGRLKVRRNPALTFCAASAVHVADPKGNRVYDKRKSTGRIDGIVALAMAAGAGADDDRSVYSGRGLLIV